jgi:hypothetical protein
MNDKAGNVVSFASDLRDAAARNPVSAALIGMGVLWMLTGGRSAETAGNAFRRARERIPDALDNVRAGLQESGGSIRDAATSKLDDVFESGAAARDKIGEYRHAIPDAGAAFITARDNLTELFRAQPLALGAIGLAIGAGIAAALPKSDLEDGFLGEASEAVKAQASEIVGQQAEKVTTRANDVIDAAAAEARKQGLTLDDAKAVTNDISGRVGRVLDAVKNGARDKHF